MWSGPWSLYESERRRTDTGVGPCTDGDHSRVDASGRPTRHLRRSAQSVTRRNGGVTSYVLNGIRKGRPLIPLVTYNTWFAYGTRLDETSMRAAIGAGWPRGRVVRHRCGVVQGADLGEPWNFDPGLGSWEVDPGRFPNGMKALTDYAHSFGMRFGIWVEPERVNFSSLGAGSVDEQWLATSGGGYESDHSGQICLAGPGRQWVLDRLTKLIDEVQPDYLKWDSNMWTNCDREGHDHGPSDGSFAHVAALYQVLDTLRQQYPDLLIENCAGGANRIDFGMLRYTDAAWMDDHRAVGTRASQHRRPELDLSASLFAIVRHGDASSRCEAGRTWRCLSEAGWARARFSSQSTSFQSGRSPTSYTKSRSIKTSRDVKRSSGGTSFSASRAWRCAGMGCHAGRLPWQRHHRRLRISERPRGEKSTSSP